MFFWVRLYVLRSERDKALTLVHGYAVQTIAPESAGAAAARWSRKDVHHEGKRWTLRRYTCLMSAEDLYVWCNALTETEEVTLSTGDGDHRVRLGGLIARPPVYAVGRDAPGGPPRSPSGELAILETLWDVEPQTLLERLFPLGEYTIDARMDALTCLLDRLERETGIRFRSDEAGRLGNLEVARYPVGSYEVPGGLCIGLGDDLLVWARPPLSGEGDLFINCRLYSGGVVNSDGQECTIVLDEVRRWPPDRDDMVLRFAPAEEFGSYEVSAWRASDGALLARERGSPINHIGLSMVTPGPVRRALSPWTEQHLPAALREAAATRRLSGLAGPFMSGRAAAPWLDAEQNLRRVVRPLFPRPDEGRFFTPQADRTPQLALVDYIVEQVERQGIQRAILADPYFGTQALWMLVPRLQAARRLTVITSLAADEANSLREVCQRNQSHLHFRIINVTTTFGGGGQFHDRYLVLERGSQNVEALILSSSLNYGSTDRNPIAAVPLAPHLSWQVARYVEGLVGGQVEGRSDLQSPPEVLCEPAPPGVLDHEMPANGLRPFPGWEVILQLLRPVELPLIVNGTPNGERPDVRETHGGAHVDEHTTGSIGLLVHDPVAGETRWELPSAMRAEVASRIVESLAQGSSTYEQTLPALAEWAYRDGPKQEDYAFGAQAAEAVEAALVRWVTTAQAEGGEHWGIAALDEDWGFARSLDQMWSIVHHDVAHLDLLRLPHPAKRHFLVPLLWRLEPSRVVEFIQQKHSYLALDALVESLRDAPDLDVRPLLAADAAALRAAGVALLRHALSPRNGGQDDEADSMPDALRSQLELAGLADFEKLLAVVDATLGHWRPMAPPLPDLAPIAAAWPERDLTAEEHAQLAVVLVAAAPLHWMEVIAMLATRCPRVSDAHQLREWGVGQFLQQLPLRQPGRDLNAHFASGAPPASCYPELDDAARIAVAQLIWDLHGADTLMWFADNVLGQLDLGAARFEPLLRTRDYSRWDHLVQGLISGLLLAVAVVEAAPDEVRRSAGLAALATDTAVGLVERVGTEVWLFNDYERVLARLVVGLAGWLDDPAAPPELEAALERVVLQDTTPAPWRLRILLGSAYLTEARSDLLLSLLRDPNALRNCPWTSGGRSNREDIRELVARLRARGQVSGPLLDDAEAALKQLNRADEQDMPKP